MTTTQRLTAGPVALPLSRRSAILLSVSSLAGLAMFVWPLLITPAGGAVRSADAPWVFVAILPVILAVCLSELADSGLDTKALALLAVLSAIGAVLRPLGAGTAGIELVFFLLVPAGRVLGPGFGFVLGCTTLFASALLTGGVGPWLPYQMLGAAWVGMGAGLLPARGVRGRSEIAILALWGGVSAYLYGLLLNLTFWPFAIGTDTALSFLPGGAVLDNLQRFLLYTIATSTLGWDTGRAVTTVVAIIVAGPATLAALRRVARRASFEARGTFTEATTSQPSGRPGEHAVNDG